MKKVYVKPEVKDRDVKVKSFVLAASGTNQSNVRITTGSSESGSGIWSDGSSSGSDANSGLW